MANYYLNKVVVITGAASGMGQAYAKAFALKGAKLALNDFDAKGLQQTVTELAQITTHAIVSQAFNVADFNAMQQFAHQVQQQLGLVDIVINNAGIGPSYLPTWELPLAEYERVMQVNFNGVLNGCKAFLPQLLEKGHGHIVNVSSIFGLVGTPNHSAYCASKFAVRGFTEALMTELNDSAIQVHLLHPGGIKTNICENIAGAEQFQQKYLNTSPDAIANYLLKQLPRGTQRMVFGQDSFKTWMGATFLPLQLMNRVMWSEVKKVIDLTPYAVLKKHKKDM